MDPESFLEGSILTWMVPVATPAGLNATLKIQTRRVQPAIGLVLSCNIYHLPSRTGPDRTGPDRAVPYLTLPYRTVP